LQTALGFLARFVDYTKRTPSPERGNLPGWPSSNDATLLTLIMRNVSRPVPSRDSRRSPFDIPIREIRPPCRVIVSMIRMERSP
jgi:hypothetical protein